MLARPRPARALAAAAAVSVFILPSVSVRAQQSAPASVPAVPTATHPGDRVPIRVQVIGAVSRPGEVELTEGDRLSTALARAGTAASLNSDLTRVYLVRTEAATQRRVAYQINVAEALQTGEPRFDPLLRQGDKIFVPEARAPVFGRPHPPSGNGFTDA